MTFFTAALWAEWMKTRRSLILLLSFLAVSLLPLAGGLFMIILKDPAAARDMGLIGMKSQLMAGSAEWPVYFSILLQGTAVAGSIIFALMTSWIFGSEFSNRTNSQLLALPAPRTASITAKFALLGLWIAGLTSLICLEGLGIGFLVDIPGWSADLGSRSLYLLWIIAALTYMLMPLVALLASAGRGYLAPMGWALFTLALAQIAALLGWGEWVPWAVPALLSGAAGSESAALPPHSYVVVLVTFALGVLTTVAWWQHADQPA
jgi:ABC-2 type transport system permease protein